MIPTAEEFLATEEYYKVENDYETQKALIEFAKLHVETALKAATENAKLNAYDRYGKCVKETYYGDEGEITVNSDSILTSYPLSNIK